MPAALVWHHHRASVRAYWRQQVGYGEGQAWLVLHHRERFTGANIAWRGHIYSPLPFVRSLSRPRVNLGIWGSAAFPSVYHMQAFSLAFLPHTVRWQIVSATLVAAAVLLGFVVWPAAARPAAAIGAIGLAGLAITVCQCVRYALASDIESLPGIGPCSRRTSRAVYRLTIAWLHLLQPFARARGYVRGMLSPSTMAPAPAPREPRPSPGDLACALYLFGRGTLESRFWAERWIGAASLLTGMTDRLRSSPLTRRLDIEDGWPTPRDIRVPVWPFAWLDLLVLVENHGAGRSLIRIGYRLQPSVFSNAAVLAIVAWPLARLQDVSVETSSMAAVASLIGLVMTGIACWRSVRMLSTARRLIAALARDMEMQPLGTQSPGWRAPRRSSDALVTPVQSCEGAE